MFYSYVAETGRCVVPDHDGLVPLSSAIRTTTFQQESVTGAKYYFFMADMVAPGNKSTRQLHRLSQALRLIFTMAVLTN